MPSIHAKRGGPVGAKLVKFDEGTVIQECFDTFTGGLFSPGVLAVDGSLSGGQQRCFTTVEIVFELASRSGDIRGGDPQLFTSVFGVGQRVLQGRVWPVSWIILPVVLSEGSCTWRSKNIDGSHQAYIGSMKLLQPKILPSILNTCSATETSLPRIIKRPAGADWIVAGRLRPVPRRPCQ